MLEVRAGIEPAYADLQSAASPLCHRTPGEAVVYRVHCFARSSPHQVGWCGSIGVGLASCPARRYKRHRSHHDEAEMDRASQAFADPRNHMVDSQVRPNKVTDPRILAAMRHLPRERFIPDDLAALAYADADTTGRRQGAYRAHGHRQVAAADRRRRR